jgi:hypothetical protein
MTNQTAGDWQRWYRAASAKWIPTGIVALPAIFLILCLTSSRPVPVGLTALDGVVTAAAVVAFVLNMRAGILVDAQGVTVRSMLGFRSTVPWSEVARFSVVYRSGRGSSYRVVVQCRDRRPLSSPGCTFMVWTKRGKPQSRAKADKMASTLESVRLLQTGVST